MAGRDVYLVGSVPMANAEQVFEAVSAALGRRIKRIPDGETGERGDWITWLEPVFAAKSGAAEVRRILPRCTPPDTGARTLHAQARPHAGGRAFRQSALRRYRERILRGVQAAQETPARSPPETKFQIDLVPAHSVIWLYLVDELHAPIDPIYNEAVKREIDKIAAALPHDEIAIQFDVASAVFARLERNQASSYGRTKEETQETFSNILLDLGNRVPPDIDLLFHLCYGDSNHKHVVEPTDMGDMVEFANRVCRQIKRPDPAHPHAGAAQPRRRRVFRAVAESEAAPGNRALPRARSLHRRGRGHQKASRDGAEVRAGLLGRHRMRLWPARSRRQFRSCCASTRRSPIWTDQGRGARAPPRAGSHLPLDHLLLDLGDRLRRIEPLRAGLGAVHDGVAAVEPERILQVVEPLAGRLVAAVVDPAVGLQQRRRAEIAVDFHQ